MNLLECKKLTEELFEKHGLTDWKFFWIKRLANWRCAGYCNYKYKQIRLQPNYVEKNNIEEVTNTILHEIAHALMPKHGHNKFWKMKAKQIGCNGSRTYSRNVIK